MSDPHAREGAPLDVAAYADRLSYRGTLDPSVETLRGLHEAHVLTVPFENLDVHLGRPISLAPSVLFRKIVHERRGGYCYELNGLFAVMLERLGFAVRRLMARVLSGAAPVRPRSHEVLLVEAGGERWIADVGFGGNGLIAPLPLRDGHDERQYADRFRVVGHRDAEAPAFTLQHDLAGSWHDLYEFTLEQYRPEDYIVANYYNSHSPDSLFVRHVICTKPTRQGRVMLLDQKLKIRTKDGTHQVTVAHPDDVRALLKEHFGIDQGEIAEGLAKRWDSRGS